MLLIEIKFTDSKVCKRNDTCGNSYQRPLNTLPSLAGKSRGKILRYSVRVIMAVIRKPCQDFPIVSRGSCIFASISAKESGEQKI